jgi:deoxyribodipyrimidine photo-lyase
LNQLSISKYNISLFVFRRDLRIEDNTALQAALQSSKQVIPCFIFDPRQVEDSQNAYKSNNALQFMIASLIDLDKKLLSLIKSSGDNGRSSKLYIFCGEQENVIEQLIQKYKINAIFVNKEYTPL